MGGVQIPSTGDHISIPGYYGSGSKRDSSGMGLYRHHMLAAAPATTVYKGKVLKCYIVIVIHLTEKGIVVEEKVLKPGVFRIHTYPCKFDGILAVEQAQLIRQQRPGSDVYNLVTYNCENFVREAKTGTKCSRQVRRTVGGISGTVVGGAGTIPAGIALGGLIGTAVPIPGVGTVVGGVAGGVVGGGVAVVTSLLGVATDCLVERIQEC